MNCFKRNMFIIICSFTLSFCLNAKEIQQVTILADDSYPPYSFLENGELKGIYIDTVRESAKLMSSKYEVTIVAVPWTRGLRIIKEGKAFAILPPYQHIKKRHYIWPYSLPLMTENIVAFCHKDINLFEYISQPSEKKSSPLNIGINTAYLILNESLQQAKITNKIVIRENKSTYANIMKLYARRIDCYLNDKFSTLWQLSKMSKENHVNFDNIEENLLVMSQTAHIGYTNNKNHGFLFKNDFILSMDKALSVFISSEKYQKILSRYQ